MIGPVYILTQAELDALQPKQLVLWQDAIQTDDYPWGFNDNAGNFQYNGANVLRSDDNGSNLTRVPDPLGGPGFCLRHFANMNPGARSQIGIGFPNFPALQAQIQKPEGIFVEAEFLFPVAFTTAKPHYQWINLWDFHSVDVDMQNRQHTSPGVMLLNDGSMRCQLHWGATLNKVNPPSAVSSIPFPVGKSCKLRMHYVWSLLPTTISLWIDDQLAIQQEGVITRLASNANVEMYFKLYGGMNGDPDPWIPTPSVRYTRNVRISGERIWR
jgi:hypothetical protein